MKKSKFIFYFISYLIIIFFTIFGLIFNIWSLALNEQISNLERETRVLKEQNKTLELSIIETKSIENLEKIATEKLQLFPPKRIYYLKIN